MKKPEGPKNREVKEPLPVLIVLPLIAGIWLLALIFGLILQAVSPWL